MFVDTAFMFKFVGFTIVPASWVERVSKFELIVFIDCWREVNDELLVVSFCFIASIFVRISEREDDAESKLAFNVFTF